jgi:hypothetical protein
LLFSEAILSSDDQPLPNLGETFHARFSAVKLANYFAIRHESCRANPKRKESLAELIRTTASNFTTITFSPNN